MKLMAEFANRQRSFLKKAMEFEGEEGDPSDEYERNPIVTVAKEYECIICSQTSSSTEDRPIGMVVLLQATSVLGHAQEAEEEARKLPCTDEERLLLLEDSSRAAHMKLRFDGLARHFDDHSWSQSVNIGWEGGVHVQSCGHYIHVDCHKSYMLSQKQSQRLQTVAVERGEYWCPLCRQLANSVLPLHPEEQALALARRGCPPLRTLAHDLLTLLEQVPTPVQTILKPMASFMEDLTNTTFGQYRSLSSQHSTYSLVLFVCSVARTNLEAEIVYRKGTLCSPQAVKKSCFVPLFHVLSLHAKVLTEMPHTRLWSHLTGLSLDDNPSRSAPFAPSVPFSLGPFEPFDGSLEREIRSAAPELKFTTEKPEREVLEFLDLRFHVNQGLCWEYGKENSKSMLPRISCLSKSVKAGVVKSLVRNALDRLCVHFITDSVERQCKRLINVGYNDSFTKRKLEMVIKGRRETEQDDGTHFLKSGTCLFQDLEGECESLCHFLGLTGREGAQQGQSGLATSCLSWATSEPHILLRTWCQDFGNFVGKSPIAARGLVKCRWRWAQPRLLLLPGRYDQLFQYYHSRACRLCHSVPKDPSVCLVCGTLVCLRENCCRQQAYYEAVHHSINCGAGTAIFLAVNSSTIIVIRGKRACLWGSVYLDSFGEEDRDLKRGKPLYLSVERYQLLQEQWTTHAFDHTSKRWVWHKDNL
ncbi:unnamed protein product [Ixodes pacificus]